MILISNVMVMIDISIPNALVVWIDKYCEQLENSKYVYGVP